MSNAVSVTRWAKLIGRWSGDGDTPEVKLVAAMLAQAITEEPLRIRHTDVPPYTSGFFALGAGFCLYCNAIGVNPVFLREQIQRAADYEAVMGL